MVSISSKLRFIPVPVAGPIVLGRASTPLVDVGLLGQGDKYLAAWCLDATADVSLAGGVIGQEDLARTELTGGSVAYLDLDDTFEVDDELAPWGAVKVVYVCIHVDRRFAEERSRCGDGVGDSADRAVALMHRYVEIFEMGLSVFAGVDTSDLHELSLASCGGAWTEIRDFQKKGLT